MKKKRTLFTLLCLFSLLTQAHASSIWEEGSQWDVYYIVEGESTGTTDSVKVTYRLLPAFDNYMALEKTFTINDMDESVQIQGYIRNAGDSLIYVRPVLDDGSIGDECLLYDFREPYEYGHTLRYGVIGGEVKEEFIDWQEDSLDYYMMNNGDTHCLPAWKGIIYKYGYIGGPMDLFLLEAVPGKFTSGKNNKPKPTNISHVIFSTKGGYKINSMNYEEDDIIVTYNAMLKEATTWECMAVETERPDFKKNYSIQVMGDTLIGNRRCKQVYSPEYDVQKILFEEGRKVYIVNADGNPEVLLDFNLQEGDHWLDDVATVVSVDNQENLGYDYRTITIDTGLDCQSYFEGDTSPWAYNLIEGIGVSKDQHLKQHFISEENTFSYMLRCWKDDTLVYQVAQEHEYIPFVREGVKWVYKYTNEYSSVPSDPNLAIGTVYLTLEIKGDTVINGKTYKAMHKYYGDAINSENDTVPIYLREEEKVVYGFVPDGVTYSDCPIGNRFDGAYFFDALCSGEEFILYDFRDPVTYWDALANSDDNENYYKPLYTDAISIGDNLAKRYVGIMGSREFYQIEGIGVDAEGSGYTLFPFRPMASGPYTYFQFSHMIKDGEIIYKGVNYKEPEPEEYVPFVREGVKWVYEFTFADSFFEPTELGSTWLTLELKGDTVINGKTYKAMHKYCGEAINEENDTIPVYLREENKVVYGIVPDGQTYRDCPIGIGHNETIYNQIINGEEFVLYDFLNPKAFWIWTGYLPEESNNFGVSDKIQIGSHIAQRYRFDINNSNSESVIEGIGFDKYGCGYILYPFTPFFAGLGHDDFRFSHVIENGEIIYKSVNYREPQTYDDYEYVPFVREGVKWIYRYINPFWRDVLDMDEGIQYYSYEMEGDVLIGDKYYKPVVLTHYLDNNTKEVEDFIPVYLREENKVVYAILPDGILHPQCPVGYCWYISAPSSLPIYTTNEEFVLYDFNNMNSFYNDMRSDLHPDQVRYNGWDMINIGSHKSKRYHYDDWYDEDEVITESIGYDGIAGMPLFYFELFTTGLQVEYGLSHVVENGEIVYKGKWYSPEITLGVGEVVVDLSQHVQDGNYYNLMGQPVGKDVPTVPGIYIHQGKKILVR